ncbi:Calcium-dependent protein kinase 1 [Hondaea fermentalgiana]|uniref:Calcium-dependent protein kinase 1 n=1 Tax=Hondaea fermentalgiana TaxID=2315210 RepID=A0A2R5GVC9_9STRA|nr:Calcium-dependent protein kinase 1 [Hondaea fermentalgiana]|eukprot:GBG31874.1 Calcium-dependent protein kinase 1 [Hondaea fermentalgiana]
MGAGYSSNDDIHMVIRTAVVSSRQMLLWSKPEEMANVVNSILEEMDVKRTGIISKPGFFKAAALLDLETNIEVLEDIFCRLDPEEDGFVERSLLQRLATTRRPSIVPIVPGASPVANRPRKFSSVNPPGQQLAGGVPLQAVSLPSFDEDTESWREILSDFEAQYLESVARDATLDELQSLTQFSGEDLQKLRARFYDEANASALTVERFCAFLTREYPQLEGHQALLLRLFALFDTDSNGTVDFRELIMGLVKTLDSGVEDKMSLLFNCIDLSSDGNINLQELTHVVAKNQSDLKASIDYAQDFFGFLDTDQSGHVSLEEFKANLKSNPQLYKSLLRALPLPTTALGVMEELQSSQQARDVSFSLDNLKLLYKEYSSLHKRSKQGSRAHVLTRKAFRGVMGKHFGLHRLDQQKLLDRLFDAFDTDRSGSVSLEEILRGVSLLIATKNKSSKTAVSDAASETACLDFYLDLIEGQSTPASGSSVSAATLNENMLSVLERSKSKLRAEFEQSKNLIEELARTSTTISGKDLLTLSQQHPELLNVLRQNLMR